MVFKVLLGTFCPCPFKENHVFLYFSTYGFPKSNYKFCNARYIGIGTSLTGRNCQFRIENAPKASVAALSSGGWSNHVSGWEVGQYDFDKHRPLLNIYRLDKVANRKICVEI